MPTQATSAFGVTVTIGGVVIPEITDLTPVAFTAMLDDVTAHDSPGGWDVDLPVIKDGSELLLEANWVPGSAGHAALLAAALTSTSVAIEITYHLAVPPTVWAFHAFVTEFEVAEVPVGGVLPLWCVLSPDQAMVLEVSPSGSRSFFAHWLGGAGAPVAAQRGVHSYFAHWMGGARSP